MKLTIETRADAATYKPGDDASIHFHVTNARGEGVSAALGLQVVDEAVFALAEKQPGFAKVFFYLEQEVMKPRYEIHSLSMSDVVEPQSPSPPALLHSRTGKPCRARALLRTELAAPARLDVEFGRSLPQDKFDEYQQRYAKPSPIRSAGSPKTSTGVWHNSLTRTSPAPLQTSRSRTEPTPATPGILRYASNAPTGTRAATAPSSFAVPARTASSTLDDLTVYVQVTDYPGRSASVVTQPGHRGSLDLRIEHDRGPFNGLAEVAGSVSDPTGAVVAGSTIPSACSRLRTPAPPAPTPLASSRSQDSRRPLRGPHILARLRTPHPPTHHPAARRASLPPPSPSAPLLRPSPSPTPRRCSKPVVLWAWRASPRATRASSGARETQL